MCMLYRLLFLLTIVYSTLPCLSQEIEKHELHSVLNKSESFRSFIEMSGDPTEISGTKFLDYHSGIKKAYLFNGSFRFPFTLKCQKKNFNKPSNFLHLFQFFPEINVRIYQNDSLFGDKSKPVRTPSYIPKISYFISHSDFWERSNKTNYYLRISALHHSNGEDGWEFDYPDSLVNIYDGSFSESLYFQASVGAVKNTTSQKIPRKNLLVHKNNIKQKWNYLKNNEASHNKFFGTLGFEFHPQYFSNEKFFESQLYGGNRFFFRFNFQRSHSYKNYYKQGNQWITNGKSYIKEAQRFMFHASYISDLSYRYGSQTKSTKIPLLEAKKRLNLTLSFYQSILNTNYLAFFAQLGYHGSDNYNIYFQQSNFIARMGLAFGIFEHRLLD